MLRHTMNMCQGRQENRTLLTIVNGHQILFIDPFFTSVPKKIKNFCYIVPNSLNNYYNVDMFGSFAHY